MAFQFNQIFRSFSSRNYRLLFIGNGISLVGTWMQMVAVGWLVYRLTNSPLMLGLVGFFSQLPAFLIVPFGGVIADRLDRRRVLILTQTLSMIQALTMASLIYFNVITVWQVMLLGILLGVINAFDMPVGQAFIVQVVDKKEDLGNAIALNASMVNIGRLLGPAIAGIVIAGFGEGMCFLLNGISYLAAIFALLAVRLAPFKKRLSQKHILQEMREGIGYALRFLPIKYILLLLATMSFIGMPYMVLMPVFARDILHGGPQTLGLLMASSGLGAFIGAIYLASRKNVVGLARLAAAAAGLFGCGLIAFSLSRMLWLSMLVVLFSGFGMMLQMASSNTILQTIVDEDKRGRVMSLFAMAFLGMAPFGSLLAGWLAYRIGASNTILISGFLCVLAAAAFASRLPILRQAIHPIYIKMGIIPEISTGIQTATDLTRAPEEI